MRLGSFIPQIFMARRPQGSAKRNSMLTLAIAAIGCAAISIQFAFGAADGGDSSPIFGVKIPAGYRQWELDCCLSRSGASKNSAAFSEIAVADEGLSRTGRFRFLTAPCSQSSPGNTCRRASSTGAFVPGPATTVQIMVKDSKKYAATGGWGFGRFVNGKPVDQAQHETCVPCHQANVKDHDLVFTRDWRPEFGVRGAPDFQIAQESACAI
jgi:hypothetical protein